VADLGALERAIMDHLWAAEEPLLIRELLERINADRAEPLAYTTVQTVADRLATKGILLRIPAGRANRYEPVRTREEYVAALMVDALGVAPDRGSVFAHFVELVDGDDVRRLRDALRTRTD
jgi:predicted transcriptional regulator